MSQIHVFWDVQSCPIDISIILPVLREKGYHGRVLFRPYLPYQGDEPLLGYRDDGYARVPSIKVEGDSYAAIARMLLDILFWAMNHDDLPQNLILISQPSKDIDIVIQALERRGFNIIFKPSDDEVTSHTINDSFESLCKIPPDTANQTLLESPCRTITDVSRKLKRSPVIIFWLVDSCPSNPYEFRNKFSSTLEDKGYADYESVTAYVEEGKNSDEVINVCRKSELQVRLAPEGDEFGKFSLMLLDMINWTQASGAPFNFLVISKPFRDAMCDSVFKDVKSRGFNVLFEMIDYMVTFGSSLWSAKSILDTSFSFSSQELA
ncbi:BnaC04g32760D [Brassica napus]|uniref:BnaC04g32760D protein n=1 Tax=Brassica napus TaxID=3708 RepID=A0A078HHV8_BRANA|nr:BnaC04g32760D [Brassica napus]